MNQCEAAAAGGLRRSSMGLVSLCALLLADGPARATCEHPAGPVPLPSPGDVTGSGSKNVADALCVQMAALTTAAQAPLPSCLTAGLHGADVNCDGIVNVLDVQAIVAAVLGDAPCPAACTRCSALGQGSCLIDGVCVPEGALDPTDGCRQCRPDLDAWGYSETDCPEGCAAGQCIGQEDPVCGPFRIAGVNRCVYTHVGEAATFTPPSGITSLSAHLWGAGGGGGGGAPNNDGNSPGGAGGYVFVALDPGALPNALEVRVGGGGGRLFCGGTDCQTRIAGGGGGASGLYLPGTGSSIAIAGAGGGAAWYHGTSAYMRGGHGGGPSGTAGCGHTLCGAGGTQSAGGASGGSGSFGGFPGGPGQGGAGGGSHPMDTEIGRGLGGFNGGGHSGMTLSSSHATVAGGGGGGHFGGGGGGAGPGTFVSGGGGGGAGYVGGAGVLSMPAPQNLAGTTVGASPAVSQPPLTTHALYAEYGGALAGGERPVGYGGCSGNPGADCSYTAGGHGLVIIEWTVGD